MAAATFIPKAALWDLDDEIAALRIAVEKELHLANGRWPAPTASPVPSTGESHPSRVRRRNRSPLHRIGFGVVVGMVVVAVGLLVGLVAVYIAASL